MSSAWVQAAVAVALVVLMLAFQEGGFRLGQRRRSTPKEHGQIGALQGAAIGLLGLLLGFAFSGSTSRFIERQDIIIREANAIGTAALRADLLEPGHRAAFLSALRTYTNDRVMLFNEARKDQSAAIIERLSAAQEEMWSAAVAGVRERPAVVMAVLPPVNEVIDLHSVRNAASFRHLPVPVMGLLIVCAAVAMGMIGYGCGLAGARQRATSGTLAILIAASLWTTIDLDHPKLGLIRINGEPLMEVQRSLARP